MTSLTLPGENKTKKFFIPAYCHSMFPPEDKIIDFMNLDWDRKDEIIAKVNWYPVKELHTIPDLT